MMGVGVRVRVRVRHHRVMLYGLHPHRRRQLILVSCKSLGTAIKITSSGKTLAAENTGRRDGVKWPCMQSRVLHRTCSQP